jgi:hypothetical protein
MRWWWLGALLASCAPRVRYATEADAAASGVVLRAWHVNVRSGGELTLVNTGPRPCFVARPYGCCVFVRFYDEQHQQVKPARKRPCRPPGQAGPAPLGPGDSLRYALGPHLELYTAEALAQARYYEVGYEGTISPKRRARRFPLFKLNTVGAIE